MKVWYYLAWAAIFYIGFDVVSTVAAYNALGTFEYEASGILRAAYDLAGIPGFIAIKTILASMALYFAYLLVEHFPKFRGVGKGILAGAGCAGLYVGTSNFNVVYNMSSFWLCGLDSGTVAALIIIICAIAGFLLEPGESARVTAN
jgi:hypothetical protein